MANSQSQNRVFLLLFCLLIIRIMDSSLALSLSPCKNTDPVMPTTPLLTFLERIQETALTTFGEKDFDPKLYVDLPLVFNLSTTEKAFNKLPTGESGTVSAKDLEEFLATYFNDPGKDVLYFDPADFVPEPYGFLPKLENPELRIWALKVHSLWKNLSRKVSDEVKRHPELHTLLPLPAAPVIIPGSRFREVYYWDSYWVIRGLLASKMYETANAIVTNLISLVETYGFVPNGARAYYTNRSEPPLLSSMVHEVYHRTHDMELAKRALPALLKEHQFWNSEIHKVTIMDARGNFHNLSRYYAKWNKPRPESSTIDKKSASKFTTPYQKQQFYREVASTAESGWDFSSRWMRNSSDFTTLATTSILPVDLNVFILKMELDIAFLAKEIGEESIIGRFMELSQARKEAINSIFWNDEMGQWFDYWITNDTVCQEYQKWEIRNQNRNAFASNFFPLWICLFHSDNALVENVTRSLWSSGLVRAAGIAPSLTNSGQQWDFPNGWAPLQHLIVEGLARSGSQEAKLLAEDIAVKWIKTNYVGYKKTGAMHEKYNVEKCGETGGGGEYVPQTGFGWSNGVVLAFLEEFGWPQHRNVDC